LSEKRTNPIGAGTKNVTGNVSEDLYNDLVTLAGRSDGVGISTYAKCLFVYAVERSLVFPKANEMKGRAANYRGTGDRTRGQTSGKASSSKPSAVGAILAGVVKATGAGGSGLSSRPSGADAPVSPIPRQPRPSARASKTQHPAREGGAQK